MLDAIAKPACYWVETVRNRALRFSPLPGDLEVDVAVIGGGIVGMTAAARLLDKGKSVAVLDAGRVGWQVTGRSTAKITSQHNLIYCHLTETFGADNAQLYADANQTAIKEIAGLITRYEIDCDFERKSAWVYARTPDHADKIRKEADAAKRLGLPATFSTDVPLPFKTEGGIAFSDQAQFNPCKYISGLARTLAARGCWIFENTRATAVEDGPPCQVRTNRGTVSARDVVMATHMPINKTGMYFAKAFPYAEPVIAARITPDRAPDGMFISAETPTHSVRTTRDEYGQSWLISAGHAYKTGHAEEEKQSFGDLLDFVQDHFGVHNPDYYWTNEDYHAMDGVPFIGRSAGGNEHLFVATGFRAWGITTGTAAGMIIADLVTGQENPWAEFFDAARRPLKGGTGFVVENAKAGAHLVHGHIEKRPHTIDDLQPGEGRIIKQDGEQIAVYRDDDNELYAVSAVCPHLGCVVGWNGADRTWDCPCHGSRFDYDGRMLHGPATADLEAKDLEGPAEKLPRPLGSQTETDMP